MKTVALDAMGGDNAPRVEVAGAIAAARTGCFRVILVGDKERLECELKRQGANRELPVVVRHASQVVTMHDSPSVAIRRKTNASMRVAVDLVKSGEAEAVVSAGNSGAMLACGLLILKRLPGVDRPGILTTFPTRKGHAALLDMGANVECRPINLVQFAIMGASFARVIHAKPMVHVGVLSNGAEEHKGTDLTRDTHYFLRKYPPCFQYVGYIEGRDVFSGEVDVVVCDGFTGNLVLKVTEGVAETFAAFLKESIQQSFISRCIALGLLPAFKRVKQRLDYAEQGGAPLLGVNGVCIICHGGSNSKAIKNAILGTQHYIDSDLSGEIQQSLADHAELIAAAKGQGVNPDTPINLGASPVGKRA